MNTKAMISLDELVNKPDLIIQKLEKYGELVLIWNNEPYCVVSRVSSDEDEGIDVQPVSFVREEKPLPIASTRFANEAMKTNEASVPLQPETRDEYSTADSWFAGNSYQPEAPVYRNPYDEPQAFEKEEEVKPIVPTTEPKEEKREMTQGFSFMSGYLPLQRTKKVPIKSSEEEEPSTPEEPQEEPVPEEPQEKPLSYVPYEQLKKQHSNLWDIMAAVLKERPDKTMHAVDLARIINERGLYKTRDGSPVTPVQIRARVGHRPDRFQALGGNLIRLLTD